MFKLKFMVSLAFYAGLAVVGSNAQSASTENAIPSVPPPAAAGPAAMPSGMPNAGLRPQPSMAPHAALTPEENKILGQARMELQKDPELLELNAQIRALMEKRAKLTDEKLQKISPEAAAIYQRLKDAQDKMQAERRAQMEAMQAKYKAQQESQKTSDAPESSTPASPAKPSSSTSATIAP